MFCLPTNCSVAEVLGCLPSLLGLFSMTSNERLITLAGIKKEMEFDNGECPCQGFRWLYLKL